MKDLNKKIGAGVLAVGLVVGGLGFSGGLVAHADSVSVQGQVDEDPFEGIELIGEGDLDKLLEDLFSEKQPVKKIEEVNGVKQVVISIKE